MANHKLSNALSSLGLYRFEASQKVWGDSPKVRGQR